jgi:hypothetical protein
MKETETKILTVTTLIMATVLVCSFVTVCWWQSVGGLEGLGNADLAYICDRNAAPSFTVTTDVDLSDGMNQTEAVAVAQSIFNHQLQNAAFTVKSAQPSPNGIWTVNLSWGAIINGQQEALSHTFGVEINPANQTATYSHCY